jgi:hypothetical protein
MARDYPKSRRPRIVGFAYADTRAESRGRKQRPLRESILRETEKLQGRAAAG